MEPTAIIFYIVCGIAILVAFIRSKEKEKVEAVKRTEELTQKAKELEKVKTMYFQFRDYLEELFAYGPIKSEELERRLKKDFPYYRSESLNSCPLLWDLLYAKIISGYRSNYSLYYKGDAFTDIRLNFPNFLEFLETDQCGRHYKTTGFIEQDFADEVKTERVMPLDPQRKSSGDPHKRYCLSIVKGQELNRWESNVSLNLDDDQLYLMCEFKVTAEQFYRVKHQQIIFAEPINHDLCVSEYKGLFNRTFSAFQQYNPAI